MAFHEADCTTALGEKAHIKASKQLLDFITGNHVSAVTINAAGTGYTVGDTLTVAGGTPKGIFTADAVVTTVGGTGDVTGVRLHNWGSYSANPTTTANAVTGGTGSGCTLDLTMLAAEWTQDSSDYVNDTTEFKWQAHGINLSGANPYIGVQTVTSSGIPTWIVRCMSGFNGALNWAQQPGSNLPVDPVTSQGPRIFMVDSQMRFFFFASGRRVMFVLRSAPTYVFGHMGLFTPFVLNPAIDYPLPLLVSGTGYRLASETMASPYSSEFHSALPHHGDGGSASGSSSKSVRWIDGAWRSINSTANPSTFSIWPFIRRSNNTEMSAPNLVGGFISPTIGRTFIPDTWYNSSTQLTNAAPAPIGVGGRQFMICPCTIISDDAGACYVVGEVEGLFCIQGRGVAAEDRVTQAGQRYIVFPDVNSNALDLFYAIREG